MEDKHNKLGDALTELAKEPAPNYRKRCQLALQRADKLKREAAGRKREKKRRAAIREEALSREPTGHLRRIDGKWVDSAGKIRDKNKNKTTRKKKIKEKDKQWHFPKEFETPPSGWEEANRKRGEAEYRERKRLLLERDNSLGGHDMGKIEELARHPGHGYSQGVEIPGKPKPVPGKEGEPTEMQNAFLALVPQIIAGKLSLSEALSIAGYSGGSTRKVLQSPVIRTAFSDALENAGITRDRIASVIGEHFDDEKGWDKAVGYAIQLYGGYPADQPKLIANFQQLNVNDNRVTPEAVEQLSGLIRMIKDYKEERRGQGATTP